MALTYKDIIEGAERIRTNELPESNTADLVGQQLKNMAEFFLSASSDIPELRTYLLQRLQGTAADSDALRDPLKWLGSVEDDGGLNTLLDGLHAKGESEGKAKAGFFRGDYEGSPFMVESIPINYTEDTWVQSVRGRFVPVYQGTVDKIKTLTRSNTEYNILWRVCEKGTWGTWNSMTDAPTIPDTDLSMGLKDGDETSGYMQMFTRKGGCYSVTGSMTGVVTGTMMVFCDSWGEQGYEHQNDCDGRHDTDRPPRFTNIGIGASPPYLERSERYQFC